MSTVSVIIPYYNQGKYLHTAVQSCLSAYSGDLEIIVVDDGSTEAHANHYCMQAKKLDPRVRVLKKPNGGLSSARNAGIQLAKGDYIQFLDCDDTILPGKLDSQVRQLSSSHDKLVSVCGYYISNEWLRDLHDESLTISRFPLTLGSFLFRWERGFSIPIHSGLFRRSTFERISFNEDLHGKEDWVFWSTVAGTFRGAITYCPIIGAVYRLHGNGMTRSLDKMGEAWCKASALLANRYRSEYPEFEAASNNWHLKFYKGSRLAAEAAKGSSHLAPCVKDFSKHPSATLLHSRSISEMDEPVISFVVPVFNHSKYLETCIKSIISQPRSLSYEIVVVDDRSTDDKVVDILATIDTKDVPYRVFQNESNFGISVTQNLAVEKCRGKYIAFLDCDDYLEPCVIDELSEILSASDSPDYIFSDRNHVDDRGSFIGRANYGGYEWIKPSGSIENDLLLGMIASHLKVIKKDIYQAIGGSNLAYSGIQDWELALRVIGNGKFHYLNKAIYNHRIHRNSVSNSGSVAQFWMTNVLRRIYLEKNRHKGLNFTEVELNEIKFKDIVEVSRLFREGVSFAFRCNGPFIPENQINMLREFNSYFDVIYVPMKDTSSLMGYLWDHSIIRPL